MLKIKTANFKKGRWLIMIIYPHINRGNKISPTQMQRERIDSQWYVDVKCLRYSFSNYLMFVRARVFIAVNHFMPCVAC